MTSPTSRRGIIYILFNPAYPDALKIGRTRGDADARARRLSSPTGVPQPFEVLYDAVVSDAVAAEREIHNILVDKRVNPKREFFRVKMRDAIRITQEAAARYPVDPDTESEELDILPDMESRMRRWLRTDLVGLHFVQYSDLCLLRMTFQPLVTSPDAYEIVFDLRVLGGDQSTRDCDICGQPYHSEDDPCGHMDLLFDPFRHSIKENARTFIQELDAYSMCMVGIDILNQEARDYIDRDTQCHQYRVVDTQYDIWGDPSQEPSTIENIRRASTL